MATKKRGFPKGKKHAEIQRSPFGERLYKTRKSRGLSQTEFGRRIGISQRMVSHYEGMPPEMPPVSTITKMSKVLGVTVSYLLGESTLKTSKENIPPTMRNHLTILQKLPPKEQKKVIEYAEMLSKKSDD